MFEHIFGYLARLPRRQLEGASEWSPLLDVATKDQDPVIRAELSGVKQEDVGIMLQDGVLTISDYRKAKWEERGGYYVRARRYGSFSRSLTIPQGTQEGVAINEVGGSCRPTGPSCGCSTTSLTRSSI